jgi:hypothetical protein
MWRKKLQKLDVESGKLCPSGVSECHLEEATKLSGFYVHSLPLQNGKGKFTLKKAMKAHRGSTVVALHFL